MNRILISLLFWVNSLLIAGQAANIIEGTVINSNITGIWEGVNIQRNTPVDFTYRNNSITSVNTEGYMLQAGDESPLATNNNLDGEVVTGNILIWNGVESPDVITHGIFVGYNINSVIKYNYLNRVPYGIIFKSGTDQGQNMTFTEGGCAYNIWRNGKFGARVKGINGVKIFNNTFFSGDGEGWYLLFITDNMDRQKPSPSLGTKVFNNIFYASSGIPMIKIDSDCFKEFESDYNVFYCTAGEPTFEIDNATVTWTQWRTRGYDQHSVIVNPDFVNTTDLVPRAKLNFGKDLGPEWQTGLAANATWTAGSDPATAVQGSIWQVGARILDADEPGPATPPVTEVSLSLFPNPNKGKFTLELTIPLSNPESDFYIINKTGVKIYEGILLSGEISKELDLSYLHLSPGVYLFVLNSAQGDISKVFIVD